MIMSRKGFLLLLKRNASPPDPPFFGPERVSYGGHRCRGRHIARSGPAPVARHHSEAVEGQDFCIASGIAEGALMS